MTEDITVTLQQDDDMIDDEEEVPRTTSSSKSNKNFKGRGTKGSNDDNTDRYTGKGGVFDTIQSEDDKPGAPLRSIEGWIVFISGVQEEAQEDDLKDTFAEFGAIKDVVLPLDRRTGFVKGYALVEYETKKEAEQAIAEMNGKEFMGQAVKVDWAFTTPARGGRAGGSSSSSGPRRVERGGDRRGNRR